MFSRSKLLERSLILPSSLILQFVLLKVFWARLKNWQRCTFSCVLSLQEMHLKSSMTWLIRSRISSLPEPPQYPHLWEARICQDWDFYRPGCSGHTARTSGRRRYYSSSAVCLVPQTCRDLTVWSDWALWSGYKFQLPHNETTEASSGSFLYLLDSLHPDFVFPSGGSWRGGFCPAHPAASRFLGALFCSLRGFSPGFWFCVKDHTASHTLSQSCNLDQ